ncbi:hypothetical protein T492DRAFT_857886 [Pavlovales sp. CCMP2436]|nr:hypothetical protein T492DRAFT_857886 [Pavlovales sp. CCMP2436]
MRATAGFALAAVAAIGGAGLWRQLGGALRMRCSEVTRGVGSQRTLASGEEAVPGFSPARLGLGGGEDLKHITAGEAGGSVDDGGDRDSERLRGRLKPSDVRLGWTQVCFGWDGARR